MTSFSSRCPAGPSCGLLGSGVPATPEWDTQYRAAGALGWQQAIIRLKVVVERQAARMIRDLRGRSARERPAARACRTGARDPHGSQASPLDQARSGAVSRGDGVAAPSSTPPLHARMRPVASRCAAAVLGIPFGRRRYPRAQQPHDGPRGHRPENESSTITVSVRGSPARAG